jgi:hypothetical protein
MQPDNQYTRENGAVSHVSPLDLATKLRHEADDVLQLVGFEKITHPYGPAIPTGSYFLDVMVFPDIDVYMPRVSIARLFTMAGQLAECDKVKEVVFQRSADPLLPGGLYLKPRVEYGQWGRPWKIDVWFLDPALIEEKMEPMYRFRSRLTDSLREQIIRYKLSIMTPARRTPMYSGYFIYKAFIDEAMTDFDQVTRYLVANGIQIDQSPSQKI